MAKFKIEVNKEDCIGCGNCVALCPAMFEMKEGKSNVKKAEVEEVGCAQEAADSCPVQCIKITKTG